MGHVVGNLRRAASHINLRLQTGQRPLTYASMNIGRGHHQGTIVIAIYGFLHFLLCLVTVLIIPGKMDGSLEKIHNTEEIIASLVSKVNF